MTKPGTKLSYLKEKNVVVKKDANKFDGEFLQV